VEVLAKAVRPHQPDKLLDVLLDAVRRLHPTDLHRFEQALEMIVQAEAEQLLPVLVPVGSEALEDNGGILEGRAQDMHAGLVVLDEVAVLEQVARALRVAHDASV